MRSIVASATAHASGFPKCVAVWSVAPPRAPHGAITFAEPTHAEIGNPPPRPLPRHTRSASTPWLTDIEHRAAAAEARPNLVDHEQRPRLVAEIAHAPQERGGGTTHPPRPRIGSIKTAPICPETRASCMWMMQSFSSASVAGYGAKVTCRPSWLGERLAKRRRGAERGERRVAEPVVAPCEREDAAPPGREHRRLERRGHRVGAARAEQHARAGLGVYGGELLAERDLRLGRVHVAEREPQSSCSARSVHSATTRRSVPEQQRAEARPRDPRSACRRRRRRAPLARARRRSGWSSPVAQLALPSAIRTRAIRPPALRARRAPRARETPPATPRARAAPPAPAVLAQATTRLRPPRFAS